MGFNSELQLGETVLIQDFGCMHYFAAFKRHELIGVSIVAMARFKHYYFHRARFLSKPELEKRVTCVITSYLSYLKQFMFNVGAFITL